MTYLPKSELTGVLAPYSINAQDIGKNWTDQGIVANSTNSLTYCGNGIVIIFDNVAAIIRSTDYGKTWTNVGFSPTGFGCVGFNTYAGNGIVLAGDANGNILRSTDFGLTWAGIIVSPGNTFDSVTYLGNGISLAGDSVGNIFTSTDFGITWISIAGNPIATQGIDNIIYIENGIVIATDIGGVPSHILRSTDFGSTWTTVQTIPTNGASANVYLGNGIIIVGDGSGNTWRSIDFGTTWVNLGSAGGTNAFCRIASYLGDGIILIDGWVAGASGHVFRSNNYGLTWTDLGVIATDYIRSITYLGNGITVLGDQNGHVFRSDISYKIDEHTIGAGFTSGQVVSVSGQTVQISGQPISVALSGTKAAVDTVNFALIQEDVIHRKIHQGLQWFVADASISGTPPGYDGFYQVVTSGLANPIHMTWDIRTTPTTLISFGRIDAQASFSGVPLINRNFNLFLSGSVNTSVTFYGSTLFGGGTTTFFQETIASGASAVGFGTLDKYPIHPNEWVLFPGQSYFWLIQHQVNDEGAINFYASWYESGA